MRELRYVRDMLDRLPMGLRTGLVVLTVVVFASLGPVGCTPWATYPPIEGAVDISNPTLAPIPQLMTDAVWQTYIHDGGGDSQHIVLNLPEGTPTLVYDKVLRNLGGGRAMSVAGEPAYHVTEVRVRASEAHVDVIHPRPDGAGLQKMTLSFRRDLIGGFRLERIRPWRFPVETPMPNYQTPVADWTDDGEETMNVGEATSGAERDDPQ